MTVIVIGSVLYGDTCAIAVEIGPDVVIAEMCYQPPIGTRVLVRFIEPDPSHDPYELVLHAVAVRYRPNPRIKSDQYARELVELEIDHEATRLAVPDAHIPLEHLQ